ncbi:hypothetical protein B0T10DRAFT_590325 [Thelonectria olida]|uniref:Uncharacterized protein n=1 Tax=Thelonectria olida TaxID=1576542 RepID=A0A9P9AQC1_9HYPO|nr:hypothetical protein B0T10DRAFT_590325 [Thelonectria olida]
MLSFVCFHLLLYLLPPLALSLFLHTHVFFTSSSPFLCLTRANHCASDSPSLALFHISLLRIEGTNYLTNESHHLALQVSYAASTIQVSDGPVVLSPRSQHDCSTTFDLLRWREGSHHAGASTMRHGRESRTAEGCIVGVLRLGHSILHPFAYHWLVRIFVSCFKFLIQIFNHGTNSTINLTISKRSLEDVVEEIKSMETDIALMKTDLVLMKTNVSFLQNNRVPGTKGPQGDEGPKIQRVTRGNDAIRALEAPGESEALPGSGKIETLRVFQAIRESDMFVVTRVLQAASEQALKSNTCLATQID